MKKMLISVVLSALSLSVPAFVGTQQAQAHHAKPFLIITVVALVLGVIAFAQKYRYN